MTRIPPTLVATCSTPFSGDSTFGSLVAETLFCCAPPSLEVIDLSVQADSLIQHLQERAALLIVDALWSPSAPPGQLVEVDWSDVQPRSLLSHTLRAAERPTLSDQIALAHQSGLLPPIVRLIGVTVREVRLGQPLSNTVRSQVPLAAQRIRLLAQQMLESALRRAASTPERNSIEMPSRSIKEKRAATNAVRS